MEKYNTQITIKDICIKNIDSVKTNQIGLIDYIDIASVDNESKIISSFKTIDIKDAPSRAKQLIKKNDILVSTVRPNLNAVAINNLISSNIQVCSTGFCVLRPKEYVLPSYLFNFCKSDLFINEISQQATGASYPAVNSKIIKNCQIPLPSLAEQKRIAAILDKATELIALRKQQIEKLDLLVKSRFIEMFGTLPNKDYVFLEEMCVLITDGTHQPPKFVKEGIPFLFVSNIVKNTITYDTEKYITEENYIELIKRTPVEIGDILFSTVGSYGHPAVVKYDRPFCFQRHIAYLKPKKELVNSEYLHSALLSVDGQRQIEARVKGVAQKTLNLSEIRNIRLPLPSMKQQLSFASFIQKVDKTKSTLQQSLEKLELNYKALMQTYFG